MFKISDHDFTFSKWNSESINIIKLNYLKKNNNLINLKFPIQWENEISEDQFIDSSEVLKQLNSLAAGIVNNSDWVDLPPPEFN